MLEHLLRASRVAVEIPILYRRAQDEHWLHAKSINLSESGMLFGPTDLEPGTPVEIILSPPIPVAGFPTGKQVCVAQVVRTTELGAAAVRIEECRFLLEA